MSMMQTGFLHWTSNWKNIRKHVRSSIWLQISWKADKQFHQNLPPKLLRVWKTTTGCQEGVSNTWIATKCRSSNFLPRFLETFRCNICTATVVRFNWILCSNKIIPKHMLKHVKKHVQKHVQKHMQKHGQKHVFYNFWVFKCVLCFHNFLFQRTLFPLTIGLECDR